MQQIRSKFAGVDTYPIQGPRIFFENAGGALTLRSVVATSHSYAAIPDNQGRANAGSQALGDVIAQTKARMAQFMNAPGGQFFVGESGTELLFRLISTACVAQNRCGGVLGSTLEHPASRSAAARWAQIAGLDHVLVPHDDATGTVTAQAYANAVTPDTKVATIVHTSPVTGIGVDVAAVVQAIRATAPDCFIIIDGIQHAAHGGIDLAAYGADGYVISPYKVFSRHGYGVAWISDRFAALPHDCLLDGPDGAWELGTRDTGSYATMLDVVDYFEWLGDACGGQGSVFENAGRAIKAQENTLTQAMLFGCGDQPGLADIPGVGVIAGLQNPAREGLVCFYMQSHGSADIVTALNQAGIRTHIRKNDHYSGNILGPLGLEDCVRVSLCHYNTVAEVAEFLQVVGQLAKPTP